MSVVSVLVGAILLCLLIQYGTAYESKYDSIDLDEMLANDRLRINYVKCLLNEGPCTPDAQELKSTLPDAIESECSKCTEKQRIGAEKVTHYLIDNQPKEWDKLAVIYDSDGEFKRKYLEEKEMEKEKEQEKEKLKESDD